MSFNIPIQVPGADKAASDVDKVTTSLDRSARAANQASAAQGRVGQAAAEAGEAAAKAGDKAAAGLDRAARAANQARDAQGKFQKAATEAGEAGAKGGDKAAAGHDKAKKAADGHTDAITNVIHAVEAYIAIHQFEQIVDGYVEVRNKIQSVSESQENLNGLMDATYQIAQNTRASWESVASAYQRLANSSRGLGLSQKEVLTLTEELALGMRISGSSSREAQMTMMELTHAFNVGVLTGREFRVMMKDAPALMHELQVASGKTSAEFAEMGKHGKFTAQALIEWLGKAAPEIKEKFGKTIPTLGEDLQLLRNAAERFFGEAAVGSGVMASLANAARYVADHFEVFAKTALAAGEALVSLFVIEKIIALVKALKVALAENPLTALLVVVAVGISLLRQFGDELYTNEKIWQNVDGQYLTVGDHLRALWSMMKDVGAALVELVEVGWKKLTAALSGGLHPDGVELSLRNVLLLIAAFVDSGIGMFRFFFDMIVTIFGGVPVAIAEVFNDVIQLIAKMFEGLTNVVVAAVNGIIFAVNKLTGLLPAIGSKIQIPEIPNVDFTLPNPYEGAIKAIPQKIKADYKRDLVDTNVAADIVNSFMDELDKRAHDEAVKRVMESKQPNYVSDVKGKPEAGAHEGEEKLKKELRAILEASNPITAAEEKLAHAEEVITKAIAAHLIEREKATKVMEDYRRKLEDVLHPFEAWVRKQEEAMAVLRDTTREQEKATAVQAFLNDMKQKGLVVDDAQIAQATELIAKLRDRTELMRTEQQIMEQHLGPAHAYELHLKAIGDLLERGRINAKQYAEAVDAARAAYIAAIPGVKTFGELVEAAWIKAKQDATAAGVAVEKYEIIVGRVRAAQLAAGAEGKTFLGGMQAGWIKLKEEAEAFGATVANMLIGDMDKLNEAIVSAANGGEVAWGQMVESMLADLEKLALKMLEIKLLQAAFSLFDGGGGSAIAGAATGAADALGSGGGTPAVPDAITSASAAPPAIDTVARSAPPPAAYPTQSAATPAAYPYPATTARRADPAPAASAAPAVIHIHNNYDSSLGVAAIDSPAGQQRVLNTLRANRGAVRTYTGW